MKYNINDSFYLRGTKQRFKIVDSDLGGNYYLCSFKNLKYAYLSYMQKKITESELNEKYKLYKEK